MQVNTGWGVDVQVDGRRGKANTEADEGGVCSSQDPEQWVVGMGGCMLCVLFRIIGGMLNLLGEVATKSS